MSTIASQITSLAIVYSTVYSGADQRKHQSSASLLFVWGIPVTQKMFLFGDIIMHQYMKLSLSGLVLGHNFFLAKVAKGLTKALAKFSELCKLSKFDCQEPEVIMVS